MTKFGDIFPNLIPLKLDVTSDEDVAKAVKKVSAWLKDAPRSTGDVGGSVATVEERSFHALVNNAGIGYGGEVDWTDLSKFQHSIDGKVLNQTVVLEQGKHIVLCCPLTCYFCIDTSS
jgi:NAD(P)-dependent dehydrogenase (short-subunit alcohol dehydrogenase family)